MTRSFWKIFGAIAGGATLVALILLWWMKSSYNSAAAQYRETVSQQHQLENGNPYPSETNVRKMKAFLADYKTALEKLKKDLAAHVQPMNAVAPNEFQTRLLNAERAIAKNAQEHRVKLPEKFALGFDEFVSTLPRTDEVPKLEQQLRQIELLLNLIIDARVDAITMFKRVPLSATSSATPAITRTANATLAAKAIDETAVELTFSAAPSAARKVINEISSAGEQFYILRTVHVKNLKDKSPPREIAAPAPTPVAAASSPAPGATPPAAIHFIVGNEHIDVSARVEMVNFSL